jgi:phosphatidyl-myo-inositol dimannoside synthase
MNSVRILALATDAFGGRGGIAVVTRDTLRAMAGSKDVSDILVGCRSAVEPTECLPDKIVQRAARKGRIAFALDILRAALQFRPDLVYCNHLYMAPLAAICARLTRAKLVLHIHGIEIWRTPSLFQRAVLEDADLVLCVSRDTRARVLRLTDARMDRVVVLNNCVGEQFVPGDRVSARARLGLAREKVILTVGRLAASEAYKGHDRVIEAIASGEDDGLVYLIAGEGDDRVRLEQLASKRGIAHQVRFLGHVCAEDLPDLYRAADLYGMPSSGEGFGIAFLEAMASGTPAIGLAVGGACDALGDGELGACVEASAFPASLIAMLREPRAAEEISGPVRRRFGRAEFDRQVAALLKRLVSHPSASGAPYSSVFARELA